MSLWKALLDRFRRAIPPLVESDAHALIQEHGAQAYGVAQWRAHQLRHGKLVDESRPAGHWRAVSRRIATLTGYEPGIGNATRRSDYDPEAP